MLDGRPFFRGRSKGDPVASQPARAVHPLACRSVPSFPSAVASGTVAWSLRAHTQSRLSRSSRGSQRRAEEGSRGGLACLPACARSEGAIAPFSASRRPEAAPRNGRWSNPVELGHDRHAPRQPKAGRASTGGASEKRQAHLAQHKRTKSIAAASRRRRARETRRPQPARATILSLGGALLCSVGLFSPRRSLRPVVA
jgi:hypothetical protein